jgi:NCAIR mutase (PurE)-related protein
MDEHRLRDLLAKVSVGHVSVDEAVTALRRLPFEDLGYAKVDHHRAIRQGFPEVVFCQGKTIPQVVGIVKALYARASIVLATRAAPEVFAAVQDAIPEAIYNEAARIIVIGEPRSSENAPRVLVISAGTSDIPVAEEAAATAEAAGCEVRRVFDVGVAGLHRLLEHHGDFEAADVIVVVAGMEGALASVVGGLVNKPVIAVPTSVGYGASFGGLAALLSMLNSCASGVVVVNIDNGFGAGYFAALLGKRER